MLLILFEYGLPFMIHSSIFTEDSAHSQVANLELHNVDITKGSYNVQTRYGLYV